MTRPTNEARAEQIAEDVMRLRVEPNPTFCDLDEGTQELIRDWAFQLVLAGLEATAPPQPKLIDQVDAFLDKTSDVTTIKAQQQGEPR